MGKRSKRMTYERMRIQNHCAEGRCKSEIYKNFLFVKDSQPLEKQVRLPPRALTTILLSTIVKEVA